ncbi:hypothetical protein LTR16_003096 [Cryomyces antarcticus]|uniref:RRM domain-containing protein n=1 Tax=Cryomyces antarcticus TaxID=329879 RepID=A0ABR0KSU1_9PEZI|nr:hypothetical protein LTR16_003096 [Cryomyces antarcticus]
MSPNVGAKNSFQSDDEHSPHSSQDGVSLREISPRTDPTEYSPEDIFALPGAGPRVSIGNAPPTFALPSNFPLNSNWSLQSDSPWANKSLVTQDHVGPQDRVEDPFVSTSPVKDRSNGVAPRSEATALKATAYEFRPGSAMRYLNSNSRPDEPEIVKSPQWSGDLVKGKDRKATTVEPIGTRRSTPESTTPARFGPSFSTEGDLNNGSRYIAIRGIAAKDEQKAHADFLKESISTKAKDFCQSRNDDGTLSVFFAFEDLRDAQIAYDNAWKISSSFEGCLSIHYSSLFAFYDVDPTKPAAQSLSLYEGQVRFNVSQMGMTDADIIGYYSVIFGVAKLFGEVRSFEVVSSRDSELLSFRAEYYQLGSAERAIAVGTNGLGKEVHHMNRTVTAQAYAPPGYSPSPHRAARAPESPTKPRIDSGFETGFGKMSLAEAPRYAVQEHPGVMQLSPTGRTIVGVVPSRRHSDEDDNVYSRAQLQRRSSVYPGSPTGMSFSDSHRFCEPLALGSPPMAGVIGDVRSSYMHRNGLSFQSGRGCLMGPPRFGVPSKSESYHNGPNNQVDIWKIENGGDVRTTIMLRNIPNKVDHQDLRRILDATSRGRYDFMYLRIDFQNNCNVGYAFINFPDPLYIIDFVAKYAGKRWNMYNSDKVAEVSYATIQGKDCLVAKFRNSSVMQEYHGFRPKIFHTYPDARAGNEEAFPPPDNMSKMKRSLENAEHVGLFPPRQGQQHRDEQRRRNTHFDRGTPRALIEEAHEAFRYGSRFEYDRAPRNAAINVNPGGYGADFRFGRAVYGPRQPMY